MDDVSNMTSTPELDRIWELFKAAPRPRHFVEHHCEECEEHDATLTKFGRDLPLSELDNPGWYPLCGITDEGYKHLFPRLCELAVGHGDAYYFGQFIDDMKSRFGSFSPEEAVAVTTFLESVAADLTGDIANNGDEKMVFRFLRRLRNC